MLTSINNLILLIIICAFLVFLLFYLIKNRKKSDLYKSFIIICTLMFFWMVELILQALLSESLHINPIYFDYLVYINACFMPVALYNFSKTFSNTKYKLSKKLLVIPCITLLVLWTNDWHHLFYQKYSINISETVTGVYAYIHIVYTYLLSAIAFINLSRYSIKNAGIFSKQALLFSIGGLIPLIANLLAMLGVISATIYLTPICFAFTTLFFAFAIFKFNFLTVAPIALQKIVDRMSDCYLVVNTHNIITDFNETFLDVFNKKENDVRSKKLFEVLLVTNVTAFEQNLDSVKATHTVYSFDMKFNQLEKIFTIELSSIINKDDYLGTLILFKDITQHEHDKQKIEESQEMLIEQERLSSLGQMVGGIAHNLKTPIFSIAGGLEGLNDLVNEYDASIENSLVTNEDMHAIANDMKVWIEKLKGHVSYMSDVITAVKGQTVALSDTESVEFTVTELFKRVDILMKHEVKNALADLSIVNDVSDRHCILGNINSLVQILNNIISNALDAYTTEKYKDKKIELYAQTSENKIIISVKDYGPGISKIAQEKLFKQMITTKGKNGTGLGMFMSYSNIKAHFNGDMTYETEIGKGTTFFITIPIKEI